MENIRKMLLFFFLVTLLGATTAKDAGTQYPRIVSLTDLLRLRFGAKSSQINEGSCPSWQYGVETNNIINWRTVPAECELYVGRYMLGDRYDEDSKVVTKEALRHARSFNISDDGKDVWTFDIDETSLSNLPYYARRGFGVEPFDHEAFNEWVQSADASALPHTLRLYNSLRSLRYKIIFLTGRRENKRDATQINLRIAGYRTWELLIHKPLDYFGTVLNYKSTERQQLEDAGYRIVGNIGDQWSDILGTNNLDTRNFKLPNPMYYVV